MKIVILGVGYVGLVTSVGFATLGHKVVCVDSDKKKVDDINNGKTYFFEKNLSKLLKKSINNLSLSATNNIKEALIGAQITFVTVGTPLKNNKIDLSFLKKAINNLIKHLNLAPNKHVISIKSTVVPGTTSQLYSSFVKRIKKNKNYSFTVNPEFLAEGSAINDFLNQDRIIIGHNDLNGKRILSKLYSDFSKSKIIFTNFETAELSKYFSNIFFATLISFANEFANISNKLNNVDFLDVLKNLYHDRRLSTKFKNKIIHPNFLNFLIPGTGYGGSCFPKDTRAFLQFANQYKIKMPILKSVIEINDQQILQTVNLIIKSMKKNKDITILGLSFKPGTDDIRESPSIKIINILLKKGFNISVHDPKAMPKVQKLKLAKKIIFEHDLYKLIKESKTIVLVTVWPEYKFLLEKKFQLNIPIIDCRRFLNKKVIKNYHGIGIN